MQVVSQWRRDHSGKSVVPSSVAYIPLWILVRETIQYDVSCTRATRESGIQSFHGGPALYGSLGWNRQTLPSRPSSLPSFILYSSPPCLPKEHIQSKALLPLIGIKSVMLQTKFLWMTKCIPYSSFQTFFRISRTLKGRTQVETELSEVTCLESLWFFL